MLNNWYTYSNIYNMLTNVTFLYSYEHGCEYKYNKIYLY